MMKGWNQNVEDGSESENDEECLSRVWLPAEGVIVSNPQFCPNSVTEYNLQRSRNSSKKAKKVKDLTDKIRRHLLYIGWKIHYLKEDRYNMTRMRYTSPDGKVYMSLVKVCEAIGSEGYSEVLSSSRKMLVHLVVPNVTSVAASVTDDPVFEPEYCPEAVESWCKYGECKGIVNSRSDSLKAKKHLSALGWKFTYFLKENKRELRYWSPNGKCFYSLRTACEACIKDGHKDLKNSVLAVDYPSEVGKGKETKRRRREDDCETESAQEKKSRKSLRPKEASKPCVSSSKRVCEEGIQTSSHCKPRTIISSLIDSCMVLPNSKVYYRSRKDRQPLKEGKVTREGIRCDCCDQVYALSAFEAHAGSSLHRPSENIYLEDGRSIRECQRQMLNKTTDLDTENILNQEYPNNEDLCAICQCQGELVLCDCCPSSFHLECLGLKDLPSGDWFCPSCCCLFCGQGEFKANFSKKDFLRCYQCEHQYHLSCLKQKNAADLPSDGSGNCFCSAECNKIYSNLSNFLGRPFTIGDGNLTWTLIAPTIKCGGNHSDPADMYTLTVNPSKLRAAVNIMHKCFERLKDSRTKRDLVEDIIFSRRSEYNRVNYRGFYTVILEKNDEVITTATVRIFGNKMAEVPFVGTKTRYRKQGMCRVLMYELEKKLAELGIERLVLPAIPYVLSTWINSFGFSEMTKSDRLQLLSYPLLDFVDTTLLQKFLQQPLQEKTAPSQGSQPTISKLNVLHGPCIPPITAELRQTSKLLLV